MAFGDLNSAFMGTQLNPLIARALLGQQPQGGGMPPGMASPYMGQAGQSVDPRLMGQVPPSIIQALGERGNVAQNPDMPAQNVAPAGPAPLVHTAGGGFGLQGQNGPSPEAIQRDRQMAAALMKGGTDYSPVQSWTQGAARLAQALTGSMYNDRAAKAEKDQDTARREMLLRAFGMGGSTPAAAPGQADGSASTANSLDAAKRAIAKVESGGSGGYSAIGPATKSGDRAYGKYQVLGANIPQWTQEALGQRMTPQQFLANPQAQEKVFEHRFGGYLQRYGNMQDAASMWFSGKPFAGNNRSDGYNSVPQYVGKVLAAAGQGGGTPQQQPAQAPAAGGGLNPLIIAALTSNDPKFQQQAMAIAQFQAQQNRTNYQTLPDGTILALDPSGRRPPTPVYQAPTKPQWGVIGENDGQKQYGFIDPARGSVQPYGGSQGGQPPQLPKLTEAQGKDVGFYQRAVKANSELTPDAEKALQGWKDAALQNAPFVGGNELLRAKQSPEYQTAYNSARNFLATVLRKDTGAAITAQEWAEYTPLFIPTYGDSQAVLDQKRENRKVATQAIKDGLGNVGPILERVMAARQQAQPATPAAGKTQQQSNASGILQQARDAIARGADPAKVRARLQQSGIDPGGL